MKIQIYAPKIAENFQNSFWYYCVLGDNPILKVSLNERAIRVIVSGEIRVELIKGQGFYEGHKAVKEALYLGFTDENLSELNFGSWNWFQFIYKKGRKMEFIDLPDAAAYGNYNEAFEDAKELIEDDAFWEHEFWENPIVD